MHITQDQARSILAWFEAYESALHPTTSDEYMFAAALADVAEDAEAARNYTQCGFDEADRIAALEMEEILDAQMEAALDKWEPEPQRHVYEGYNVEFQGARPPRAGEDY